MDWSRRDNLKNSLRSSLWIIPLIAYVGQSHPRWLLFWILIGLLTSWMFPFHYIINLSLIASYIPPWDLVTAVRNFLLLGFILKVLISRSCFYHRQSGASQIGTSTAMFMPAENG